MATKTFQAGDIVRYRSRFLRSICDYTKVTADKQAIVISGSSSLSQCCAVIWNDGTKALVNRANIEATTRRAYWQPEVRRKIETASRLAFERLQAHCYVS